MKKSMALLACMGTHQSMAGTKSRGCLIAGFVSDIEFLKFLFEWSAKGTQKIKKPGNDLLSRLNSTIGAGGLNFRVRDGNGWDTSAIVTRLTFALHFLPASGGKCAAEGS